MLRLFNRRMALGQFLRLERSHIVATPVLYREAPTGSDSQGTVALRSKSVRMFFRVLHTFLIRSIERFCKRSSGPVTESEHEK